MTPADEQESPPTDAIRQAFEAGWDTATEDYTAAGSTGPIVDINVAFAAYLAQTPAPSGWQPIETPPEWDGPHSLRLLGVLADGHQVFCQYTPFYAGRADEMEGLWVCEGSPFATKPTHWQPLPAPPTPEPRT